METNNDKAFRAMPAARALRFKSSLRSGLFAAIAIAPALLATSCASEPIPTQYRIVEETYTPDSLKDDVARCIASTLSGATATLHTVDYEDVDDSIDRARYACVAAYSSTRVTLEVFTPGECCAHTIPFSALTKSQRAILDSLLTH